MLKSKSQITILRLFYENPRTRILLLILSSLLIPLVYWIVYITGGLSMYFHTQCI